MQWENFSPNFFVLFPPNVFANAPHTFLSSARLEGAGQDTLVSLNQLFPTVNIIDIGAILKQVKRLLDLVGLALNLVFGFTLAAGSVALYSVISVLENFEPPAFDDDRREELSEYVQRRKREIGTREM